MEDLTGKQFGPYQIVAPLGEGGMAAVYKAYQPGMERYVALKVLPRHFAHDPQFVARFEQEAKILARLQHPHILPVFDYGQADGYAYIVMPFLHSGTLTGLMSGAPLPLAQIRRIVSQVGDALDYAHSQGLIHRDVKPSNILLDERGNCLLTDFGIAKMVESSAHLTATGGFVGTPAYMSPEQGLGQKIDGRSDIYALGIILYEMAVGRVPYKAETPMAVVVKHINDPLPMPQRVNPNLPEGLEGVILKALAKQPEDRYTTAGDMVRALRAVISEPADEAVTAVAVAPATTQGASIKPLTQDRSSLEGATVLTSRSSQPVRFPWLPIAAGLILVIIVVVVGLFALRGQPAVSPTAVAAAAPSLTPAETATLAAKVTPPAATPTTPTPEISAVASAEAATPAAIETTLANDSVSPTLYDDFNDPAYEGKINAAKWLPMLDEVCQVTQQAGALVVKNAVLATAGGCNLTVSPPEEVAVSGLGVFEARFQLSSDHNGEYLNQGMTFGTEEAPGGSWYAFCGLDASGETPQALFEVMDWATGQNYETQQTAPAAYDRWYTFRLEANPETMAFDCYMDNTRLGSVAPAPVADLSKAHFYRALNAWRDAKAVGTSYVDEVRITSGSSDVVRRVAVTEEAEAIYDDFEDEDFVGEWNPELWEAWDDINRCQVEQEEEVLRFSCSQPDGSGLNAVEYSDVPWGEFNFIQARLRLDDEIQTNNGAALIKFYTSLNSWTECGLVGGTESEAVSTYCGVYNEQGTLYEANGPEASYDTWRTLKIELNSETAEITFLIDDQPMGAYTPPDVDALKQAEFTIELHMYFEQGKGITGYFDEISIGP